MAASIGWRLVIVGLVSEENAEGDKREDVKNCFNNQIETILERAVSCVCKP